MIKMIMDSIRKKANKGILEYQHCMWTSKKEISFEKV